MKSSVRSEESKYISHMVNSNIVNLQRLILSWLFQLFIPIKRMLKIHVKFEYG